MTKGICSVANCERPAWTRGYCSTHYQRLRRLGTTELLSRADRFWARVEKTDTCWLWTGSLNKDGYGQCFTGRVRRAETSAHRWAYVALVGPIPDGLVIDHLCRVRNCVNPAHMELVTPRENTLRSPVALAALNAMKTHCLQGHPYDEANTYLYRGMRFCRTCYRAKERRRQAAKRQSA
jgi:hypothetical protein